MHTSDKKKEHIFAYRYRDFRRIVVILPRQPGEYGIIPFFRLRYQAVPCLIITFYKNQCGFGKIFLFAPPLSAKTGLHKFSEVCKDATDNLTDYKTDIGFVRFTKTKRWFTKVM